MKRIKRMSVWIYIHWPIIIIISFLTDSRLLYTIEMLIMLLLFRIIESETIWKFQEELKQ